MPASTQSRGRRDDGDRPQNPFPIVGVGASAGGLEAFRRLLGVLPTDTGMAYVLVQHLDEPRESIPPDLLAKTTQMPVAEVEDDMPVKPDHVYVVPPPHAVALADGRLKLVPRTKRREPHMPIDLFLRTLAGVQARLGIGVVLSGAASDGALGLKAIKAEGGITFAQDPTSAGFDGMPRRAIASGCVDLVLPPEGIAGELARLSKHPYVVAAVREEEAPDASRMGEDDLEGVLAAVRQSRGVDLGLYDRETVRRCAGRRMAVLHIDSFADYGRRVAASPGEAATLHQDCLTPITSFFRDPEAFELLRKRIIPALLRQKPPDTQVRVWVPACATGEEAYSIAICVLEQQAEAGGHLPLRVFATDVSDDAIRSARSATYLDSIAQDVTAERLRQFFVPSKGHYKVGKAVRDVCVFARHDVTRDPPYARMDLICCRSLVLRLRPEARRDVLATLHYALQPGGFLMIGASEVMDEPGLFAPSKAGHGIYERIAPPGRDRRDRRIAQLERELDDSRGHLENLLHEYDAADEGLRTANEEALAANEELRSINEELQTAKEQVQCANEELETLNDELHERNRQLGGAADDLTNVIDSLNTAIVMVGPDLGLRRFTPAAEKVLNLVPGDVGRPLAEVRADLALPDLAAIVRGVIETLVPVDRTVRDREGRAYALRIRPYVTRDRKVDGAVIVLMDVDALKAT
jgi:chemotaxis methyl-accepting protein methylase